MMALYIIGGLILFIMMWWLLAPIRVELDSQVPYISFHWVSIGSARLFFDDEWKLTWRVFFISRTRSLATAVSKKKSWQKQVKKKVKNKMRISKLFNKMRRVLNTFSVQYWQLAVDTGDDTLNARLYPLNYLPACRDHLQVNFGGENFLKFRISNRPIRILWAWIK